MTHRFIPELNEEQIADIQLDGLKWTADHAYNGSPFYRSRMKEQGMEPGDIKTLEDLQQMPFTTANDLKEGYPMPLLSVPEPTWCESTAQAAPRANAKFSLTHRTTSIHGKTCSPAAMNWQG